MTQKCQSCPEFARTLHPLSRGHRGPTVATGRDRTSHTAGQRHWAKWYLVTHPLELCAIRRLCVQIGKQKGKKEKKKGNCWLNAGNTPSRECQRTHDGEPAFNCACATCGTLRVVYDLRHCIGHPPGLTNRLQKRFARERGADNSPGAHGRKDDLASRPPAAA